MPYIQKHKKTGTSFSFKSFCFGFSSAAFLFWMTSYCNFSAVSDRSLRDNHGQSFFFFSSGTDLLPVSAAEVQNGECNPATTSQSLISLKQYFPPQDVMPQSLNTVTISKLEYENLLQASYQFAKLKGSLLNGGLSQETLDILVYGAQAQPKPPSQNNDHNNENAAPQPAESNGHTNGSTPTETATHIHKYQDDKDTTNDYKVPGGFDDCEEDDEDEDEGDGVIVSPNSEGKVYSEDISKGEQSSTGQRTVLIRNLPEEVTHEDITDAVRGGALLYIYLRARDHFANVSFVDESAAYAFLRHTKLNGLHVAGKRVDTTWSDRQFYLPSYVRAKINGGASRVLVINNVSPFITEDLIRRDLDHIHNLTVISVKFYHGNAYISTNSVHNTLFARTCMMSRRTYKGMRIAFYSDECAEPLAKITPKKDMHPAPTKPVSRPNRFQLLSLDGTENEEEDDYENIHDDLDGHSSANGGVCWADRV